jgi:hypothetical protein
MATRELLGEPVGVTMRSRDAAGAMILFRRSRNWPCGLPASPELSCPSPPSSRAALCQPSVALCRQTAPKWSKIDRKSALLDRNLTAQMSHFGHPVFRRAIRRLRGVRATETRSRAFGVARWRVAAANRVPRRAFVSPYFTLHMSARGAPANLRTASAYPESPDVGCSVSRTSKSTSASPVISTRRWG